MKRTIIFAFKNPNVLNAMIELRRRGWTYKSLGIIFDVDHSSVYNACKIRGIEIPKHPVSLNIFELLSKFIQPPKEQKLKTYADYLEEDRRRRFPKLHLRDKAYN